MFRIPARHRPALYLLAAIFAFAWSLVWAFRYEDAGAAYERQRAFVTMFLLLGLAWFDVVMFGVTAHRLERAEAR